MQIAFSWDILNWPGVNQAFLFSLFLSTGMALLSIPYGKRRPKGRPTSWGEAMFGAMYVFLVLFIAFGVVPHQWIDHADKDLAWNKANLIYGPGGILKPQEKGGWLPLTLQYEAVRDVVVVVIHLYFFGLVIFLWHKWQTRGVVKSTELATSTYGRPLVKKA